MTHNHDVFKKQETKDTSYMDYDQHNLYSVIKLYRSIKLKMMSN